MKRAVVFLILAMAAPSVAQTPDGSTPSPRIDVPYTRFTLPNGLVVILHEDHSIPMVSVNMWYHVGSARELPKRTGFAHLFEHLMFMGSGHVKPGEFDQWLEAAGGDNNGSTETDRTNYWINVPAGSLELALFLESDRMGYLLDSMTPKTVDAQRDVVKNERRQSVENRPYGIAEVVLGELLYRDGHPYHWPVIGYMEDLTAASYDDVVAFFKKYYAPSNASLVVAGDPQPAEAPRPGHTVAELQKVIDEEIQKLQREAPTRHELERSVNQIEASFFNRMERVGGFGGKADQLNAYFTFAGDPDWFNEDLSRYRALSVSDVNAAAAQFLPLDKRVELVVEPEKKP